MAWLDLGSAASWGMAALVAVSACGRTERDRLEPSTAGAGAGGSTPSASGSGGSAGGPVGAGTAGDRGSGGLVGTGGSSETSSAVAECERYCDTLSYRLPQALCEDWNKPEWDPPFCGVDTTQSCADYCRDVYSSLTQECAEVLRPAIRCVVPYYESGALTPCWLTDCRPELFDLTSACYGLREKLAAARARWTASGVVNYQLTYDRTPDTKATVEVRADQVLSVSPSDSFAWTVPLMFDAVELFLHEPGVAPRVTYDGQLGHVVNLDRLSGCNEIASLVSGTVVTPLR